MPRFWLTIALDADSLDDAVERARLTARELDARVVQVDHEPPQGSTIVGELHEDELDGV